MFFYTKRIVLNVCWHVNFDPLGIANALDLTDRILPRLQAKPHCRPKLLNFPPYSREELNAIVQDRLTQVCLFAYLVTCSYPVSHSEVIIHWHVCAFRYQVKVFWMPRRFSSVPGKSQQCQEMLAKHSTSAGKRAGSTAESLAQVWRLVLWGSHTSVYPSGGLWRLWKRMTGLKRRPNRRLALKVWITVQDVVENKSHQTIIIVEKKKNTSRF